MALLDEFVRGGPHPGVSTRIRCGNRPSALAGARMRRGHAGHKLGVSEVVAGMFPPDNGAAPNGWKVL